MSRQRTLYRERPPVIWSTVCVGGYLTLVVYMAWTADLPEDLGTLAILSAIYLVFPVLGLLAPVARFRHFQIRVDAETLTVGRTRLPVADLDPNSIAAAQQETGLTELERAVRQGVPVLPAPPDGSERDLEAEPAPLLGGGREVPATRKTVYLATRDGRRFTVASRRPDAFLAALSDRAAG